MTTHRSWAWILASLACATSLNTWAASPPSTPAPEPPSPAPSGSDLPLWEAGVAAGAGYVPDYPGADHSRSRAAVLPVLLYRGPVLRIDGGSIRGRLADSPDWEFDLSANAAFNASNNAQRQGMADLDYLFGLGPQVTYKGLRSWPGQPALHMKLRAIFSTDLKRIDQRGLSFDPELQWRLQRVAGTSATLSWSLQPSWGSRSLQAYFYQVQPSEATDTRAAYTARAGYMGTEADITLSQRQAHGLTWFVTARLLMLQGASNRNSPMLRDPSNVSLGAGVMWTPWRSTRRASE